MRPQVLIGPMVVGSWVIAAGWLVIAGVSVAAGRSVTAYLLAGSALLLGVTTAVVGFWMVVRLTAEGLVVGRQRVRWDDIDGLAVRRASGPIPVQLPILSYRQGRALKDIALDGLSSVGGPGAAVRAVRPISEWAGVEVSLLGQQSRSGGARRVQD